MALLTIHPTRLDEEIADQVAAHTDRHIERGAEALTWCADEHVLLALSTVGWICTRRASEPTHRLGTHFLAASIATAIVPHILKRLVDQERPDRLTIEGHLRGIPLSGRQSDAFPSGHALHIGALASAAMLLPTRFRNAIWGAGSLLVTTRIVLLAHWVTDVLAGLALGAGIERGIRHVTKPQAIGRRRP
jgi:membrane-associated phospholipid phosphatase